MLTKGHDKWILRRRPYDSKPPADLQGFVSSVAPNCRALAKVLDLFFRSRLPPCRRPRPDLSDVFLSQSTLALGPAAHPPRSRAGLCRSPLLPRTSEGGPRNTTLELLTPGPPSHPHGS